MNSPPLLPPRTPIATAADMLRWQARWRALVALVAAGLLGIGQIGGWFVGSPLRLGLIAAAYLAIVLGAAFAIATTHPMETPEDRVRASLRASLATYLTVLADVAALVAATRLAAPGTRHDWVLVAGFFFVHLAEFAFTRRVAETVLVATVAGYLWLTAAAAGDASDKWARTLVSAIVYVAAVGTFMMQFHDRRGRLRRIIHLFERAEEGDFTGAYEVAADRRPDAVTAVGMAYNRVRERLERLVLTDSLTGCLNRRGFEQALSRELARASRANAEVSLLTIDLDGFKNVNDTHGHLAGDDVLRQTGELLLALVRSGDVVARSGGDEFMILCPDTAASGAEQIAGRICEQVATHIFTAQAHSVRLTASVGVASVSGTFAVHAAGDLQRRSDGALYEAKSAGRNRTSVWG